MGKENTMAMKRNDARKYPCGIAYRFVQLFKGCQAEAQHKMTVVSGISHRYRQHNGMILQQQQSSLERL